MTLDKTLLLFSVFRSRCELHLNIVEVAVTNLAAVFHRPYFVGSGQVIPSAMSKVVRVAQASVVSAV